MMSLPWNSPDRVGLDDTVGGGWLMCLTKALRNVALLDAACGGAGARGWSYVVPLIHINEMQMRAQLQAKPPVSLVTDHPNLFTVGSGAGGELR